MWCGREDRESVAAARATRATTIVLIVFLLRAKHTVEGASDEEDHDSKDDEYSYFLSHRDIA